MHNFVYNLFYNIFTFFNFTPYTTQEGFFDLAAWFYLGLIIAFLIKILWLGNPYWDSTANFRDLQGKFRVKAMITYTILNFLRFCALSLILFNCFHFGWTMGLYVVYVIISVIYVFETPVYATGFLSFATAVYEYYDSHMEYENKVITRSEKFRTLFLNQNL